MSGGLLDGLAGLLQGASSSIGRLSCCYVRAARGVVAGATPSWQYTLVPLSPSSLPVAFPVSFTAQAPALVSQADASVTVAVDLTKAAAGEISATITADLGPIKANAARAATLDHPELDIVICPQGSVTTSSWNPAPSRLEVIMLGLHADTIAELPAKLTVTVDVPATDQHTTTLSVDVTGQGLSSLPLRVASVTGPPQTNSAALDLPLLSTTNIPGIGSLLNGLGLGGLLGSGSVHVENVSIFTVDPGPSCDGFDANATLATHDASVPVHINERLQTSWTPAAQPAVIATAAASGATTLRYAVAMVGTDGSESPPGAVSAPVQCAPPANVTVKLPSAPGTSLFSSWRIYRSRLTDGAWSDWVGIGSGAGAATITDAVPAAEPDGPYSVPAQLTVDHNQNAPKAIDASASVALLDSGLVTATGATAPAQQLTLAAGLPASVHGAWAPVRRGSGPTTAQWQSPGASRATDVYAVTPRTNAHVHVATPAIPATIDAQLNLDDPATLFDVTWNASDAMDVSGDAVISDALAVPAASVMALPPVFTAAGRFNASGGDPPTVAAWQASAAGGPIAVRLRQTPAPAAASTWTDIALAELPGDVAASLLLPPAGGGAVAVVAGQWDNAPAAGSAAPVLPQVSGAPLVQPLGQLLLHRRSSADPLPPVPGAGPGPSTSAAVALVDGALDSLRVRSDALRSLLLDLPAVPAGEMQATVRLQRAKLDRALRLQLTSDDDAGGTHTELQVRIRDAGMIGVSLQTTPVGLHLETTADADPLRGVRVWSDAAPDPAVRVIAVDSVEPKTAVDLRGLAGDGSDGPLRATLSTPQPDGNTRTSLQLVQRDSAATTPWVAADATVNTSTSLVLGDGGILGAGSGTDSSGDAALVDPDAAFPGGWVGRAVTVAGWPAAGIVLQVVSPTELQVQPPPSAPAVDPGDWYALGTAGEFGVRLRTDGAGTRARVGVAHGAGAQLAGVTAGPQARIGNDEVDAFTGVTVRLPALATADVSSWSGPGESARLLGTLSQPDPAKALTPPAPPPPGWTSIAATQTARANTSLLAVVHRPTSQACLPASATTPDRGFDPVNARLLTVPDSLSLLLGAGIGSEVSLPGATGAIRMEGLQRRPDAQPVAPGSPDDANAGTERGYTHIDVETGFPPTFALVTGWKNPDLDGGVPLGQLDTFNGRSVSHWQPACTRITATGGPLTLGRVVIVSYAGPVPPLSTPTFEWSISDIWFLTLTPSGADPAELLLYSPASIIADDNQDQAVEVAVASGTATSRIFSVSIDDNKKGLTANNCRRAATEVGGWSLKLGAEIQLKDVTGKFAVKLPNLSILDSYQDDSTTAGEWWMGAYGKILGFDTAQFGSDFGTIDMRGSPFPPYWA